MTDNPKDTILKLLLREKARLRVEYTTTKSLHDETGHKMPQTLACIENEQSQINAAIKWLDERTAGQ